MLTLNKVRQLSVIINESSVVGLIRDIELIHLLSRLMTFSSGLTSQICKYASSSRINFHLYWSKTGGV